MEIETYYFYDYRSRDISGGGTRKESKILRKIGKNLKTTNP